MIQLLKNLLKDHRGAVAIETALTLTLLLVPMLLYGMELYAYKSGTAQMNRDSYTVALSLAASPDEDRTDNQIISAYRQIFPDSADQISVVTYCTCESALQAYTRTESQNSCESSCPSSQKITWKKVTVKRTYDPLVNSALVGNKKLKASNLFRNS